MLSNLAPATSKRSRSFTHLCGYGRIFPVRQASLSLCSDVTADEFCDAATAVPSHTYDILNPIMQRVEIGSVEPDVRPINKSKAASPANSISAPPQEVRQYAQELAANGPSRSDTPLLSDKAGTPVTDGSRSPASAQNGFVNGRPRRIQHSSMPCREVVDLLSRRAQTGECDAYRGHGVSSDRMTAMAAHVDVRQHGIDIAHLTLLKVIFRAGETITALVDFARSPRSPAILKVRIAAPPWSRLLTSYGLLQFFAKLQSTETLPDLLSPDLPSKGTDRGLQLDRVHADESLAVALNVSRTTVSLSVPPEATPSFPVNAANSDQVGGLTWHVVLSFLVSFDGTGKTKEARSAARTMSSPEVTMTAKATLTDVRADQALCQWPLPANPPTAERSSRVELVNCSVPITIIPGNTMMDTSAVIHVM